MLLGYINVITSATAEKPTTISRWSVLRKLIKGTVYRAARLKPRISDVDFEVGAAHESLPDVPREQSPEQIAADVLALEGPASQLTQFFDAHPPSTPVASRIGAARCLGNT